MRNNVIHPDFVPRIIRESYVPTYIADARVQASTIDKDDMKVLKPEELLSELRVTALNSKGLDRLVKKCRSQLIQKAAKVCTQTPLVIGFNYTISRLNDFLWKDNLHTDRFGFQIIAYGSIINLTPKSMVDGPNP